MSTLEFQQNLLGLRQQLYYFALSLTRDRDDAQDLLQESMLRAITYRDKFRDNTNFKAWLYTIMKNTFINDHRRAKRTNTLMNSVEKERDQVRRVQMPNSPENRVRMGEIQDSLDRLDATFREPFLMHHEGYKYHEIAEHLGIPIGTVKSRIFQARQRLMRMLTDKVPA
ncbi:MAG: RNA polymerase sigma factor [Flavobacteriales bacterium]|nr:RNA polymerase sigma factor [Flavobacteriales bacterium]MCB0788489.1 RNA polymerase sigma factor [Flavobacteriales bacterium]MCB0809555.1 RNA polymerase sigma factor [Flavobacteriales bacterium]MCB0817583.1 RNA polymerase sigma factor [Flavobacteriales bacterium]MCB9182072.1 RNA polymerase sigma factor [Flavobacteriales bacterium]